MIVLSKWWQDLMIYWLQMSRKNSEIYAKLITKWIAKSTSKSCNNAEATRSRAGGLDFGRGCEFGITPVVYSCHSQYVVSLQISTSSGGHILSLYFMHKQRLSRIRNSIRIVLFFGEESKKYNLSLCIKYKCRRLENGTREHQIHSQFLLWEPFICKYWSFP